MDQLYPPPSPNGQQNAQQLIGQGVDFRKYVFLYLRNWYWLLLGLLVGLTVAWLQLRYAIPVYNVKGTLLLNENSQRSFSEDLIVEDLGVSRRPSMENELQILRSANLMRRVVDSLGIHVTYFQEGRIKTTEQYKDGPLRLDSAEPTELSYNKTLRIAPVDEDEFVLLRGEADTLVCRYGIPFQHQGVTFTLGRRYSPQPNSTYLIRIAHPAGTAGSYAGRLQLQPAGTSDVVTIGLNDPEPEKARDIILTLIQEYNQSVIEQKNQSGEKTLAFIDQRLKILFDDLSGVEKEVEDFKRDTKAPIGLSSNAQRYLAKINDASEQLINLDLQRDLINNIESSIVADSSRYEPLPLTSEVLGRGLNGLVAQYNELIFKRRQFLEGSTTRNPAVATYDEQLQYLRKNLLLGIRTVRGELAERRSMIERQLQPYEKELDAIPTFERQLLQIMREQNIKENLFLYLLQKREETQLAIAAQVTNSRTLEAPSNRGQVSPNVKRIYLIALLLCLGLPAGLIYLIDFLDNKVYNRRDIQSLTQTPFLGSIGFSLSKHAVVVGKGNRSTVAEMFRLLRTNLQYLAAGDPGQVVLVTSSVGGEGKSFITANLGVTLALAGKKTLLLGLDLRKPKLSLYLTGHRSKAGISGYLVGEKTIDEIIRPVEGFPNLDLIGSGPIPPNPAELLMQEERMSDLFAELRSRYDHILIDTAPIGLVTDALLLKDYVDQSIMVVRFAKTTTHLIRMVDEIYQQKKLPKVGILLNGVKTGGRYYGYSYAYGYGYGHGYGYGYGKTEGYYEEGKRKKRWKIF